LAATFGERLKAARNAVFVGREKEKERFTALLRGKEPPGVWWVHGPGGVGKTTLLRECAASLADTKTPSVSLDARHFEPDPVTFLRELSSAFDVPFTPDATPESVLDVLTRYLSAKKGRVVIFVDTMELLAPLETWLRDEFLPALPENVFLVWAGRQAPDAAWSADAGWRDLIHVQALRNLTRATSTEYLKRRAVPSGQHAAVCDFTHGHPLALSLVADVFDQRQSSGDEITTLTFVPEDAPEVVHTLLSQLVEHEASPQRRAALEACALVRLLTEDLLAVLLGVSDAHELFNWLRGLSFMEVGRQGLSPHDMAREVLSADLRWRNPDQHRILHARARIYYVERLNAGGAGDQQRVLMDYVFLHRHNPVVRPFLVWRECGSLLPGPARPDETEAIVALVARHEGEESGTIAAHWLRRQLHNALVLRDTAGAIAGVLIMVSLAQASESDRALDPAARRSWEFLHRYAPLRLGEESTIFRFWMAADSYQDISPVQSLIFINVVRHQLTTPNLAYTFFPCAAPEFWAPLFAYAGSSRAMEADFEVGGCHYGVYIHDWRVLPPIAWLDMLGEREIAAAPQHHAESPSPLLVLTHEQFQAAVQDALRDWHRPHLLRANLLLRTRLVTSRAGRGATDEMRAAALQSLLREACESLREARREGKFYRALYHGYLHPAPTQERAAEQMNVPFSTYRRHIKQGVCHVANLLWQREIGL
jgi:hypothetical protein